MPKASATAVLEPPAPKLSLDLWQRFAGALQFRERVYGGLPKNPHIFDAWQKAKLAKIVPVEPSPEERERLGLVTGAVMVQRMAEEDREDVGELDETVEAGETVFRRDAEGRLVLREFMLKSAIKEATQRLGYYQKLKRNEDGMGLRSWQQTGFYVDPRLLYLMRDGQPLTEPDGCDEAQGRVPTPKGPKSILRKSEYVERPTLEFTIKMLPFKGFGYPELARVLTLVCEIGVGSWRSREEGKLDLLSFEAVEEA
jgi:hypothetical protein